MKRFEYDRIERWCIQMEQNGVPASVIDHVLQGAEKVVRKMPPAEKTRYMGEAIERFEQSVDPCLQQAIREGCACCLGGKRLQLSKAIYRQGKDLVERIELASNTPFVFGHSVNLVDDSTVEVRFGPEGLATYDCPCLRKPPHPISKTYCMCCGGHVKHHLQTALGVRASCTVVSSVLSSGGSEPCVFRFHIDSTA